MEKTYFAIALLFLGLCLGSFINAAVWRLKYKKDILLGRSECTKCHYKLRVLDLVPVFSWLVLRGKCRKCLKPISAQYPLVELATAALFVLSLAFWPFGFESVNNILQFAIWLLACVALVFLFVYDLKWLILPDKVVFILAFLGVLMAILYGIQADSFLAYFQDIIFSLLILSGFYLLLFIYSKGKWIGFGDVKLGVGLALLLCNWQLAIVALFLANLIGTLVFLPLLALKRVGRSSQIPFGPFLIIGTIIAFLFGSDIIAWYNSIIFSGIEVPRYQY